MTTSTNNRCMQATEAMRAAAAERDTAALVKVKGLAVLDLAKRCHDVNNRLREFGALYDVVKNERNKYVNLIQASHQALAEMREKIKVITSIYCTYTKELLTILYSVSME
jgi:hypothetical protein